MNYKNYISQSINYLALVVIVAGCTLPQMVKMAQKQKLNITPNPLELHGDLVNYELSAELPLKMLKKGKVYQIKSYYVYGEKEIEVKTIEFKQENFPNADTVVPQKVDKASFPYKPDITNGKLFVKGVAVDPRNGNFKETPRLEVAEGIITTSRMVLPSYHIAYANHGYNDEEEIIPTKVDFFFAQGSNKLTYKEKKSDRGQYLDAFIAEKNLTRTVTIVGHHSPEGSERINSSLSKERAKAIETFYRREMRKYDYKLLSDSIRFIIKPIVENWHSFKKELFLFAELSENEKTQILDVIDGSGTFEEKEKKISKLPQYKKVFKVIYPRLRTAQTEILTVKKKKTNAEIATLAKQMVAGTLSTETLNNEELSFAATLTPSLSEKEAIYKKAVEKSDSWAAHNNLAAIHIAKSLEGLEVQSNLEQAIAQIEIANKKNKSAEAFTNLATAYILQGNIAAAYDAAKEAKKMNPPNEMLQGLNGILASCEIRMANYDEAIKNLGYTSSIKENKYNKGLVELLSKNYDVATSILKEVNSAKAKYLLAVVSARKMNEKDMLMYLDETFKLDASLKNKALHDLEFKKYFETDSFKNIFK